MHTGYFSRRETKFPTLKREARVFLPSQSQGTVPWDEMVAGACVTHVTQKKATVSAVRKQREMTAVLSLGPLLPTSKRRF